MIKHFILTAFTLLFCLSINAQLTDVATDVNVPTGIALQGNNLYISEYDGYKISRIDITEANPIAVNVVTGITNPANLAFNGDFLYIAEPYANKISKIDVTAATPVAINVISGVSNPR